MTEKTDPFNPFDPTGMFQTVRAANVDAWSKMMIEFVNSDAYAKVNGTLLEAWLSTSTLFPKAMEKAMTQVLASLQIASREDMIRLAERLTNIEMRLDDLEAKLDAVLRTGGKEARPGRSAGPQNRPAKGD